MNRYPSWLNLLVISILLLGILVALPNVYGTAPAVQLADPDGAPFDQTRVDNTVRLLTDAGLQVDESYLQDGRVVVRFTNGEDQRQARDLLRDTLGGSSTSPSVALTDASKMPSWMRAMGLNPMSLGLDLKGGVYVLLEVDMDSAIESRLSAYEQSIDDVLREAGIRSRATLSGDAVNVQFREVADLERGQAAIREMDPELIITPGSDGRTLRVRMTEAQISERQDFAIDQNITTLRNRVDQLGVAEPLVQRQGMNRIVVQLPGVQDPNELNDILTATATLELRLVDTTGDAPGSRRYPGRGIRGELLQRDVIASGDQIINAESGFSSEGQPAVFITLDAVGGEKMLETTKANLRKPMSTVFIETRREAITLPNGETSYRTVKTEEIINTATIQGIFKDRFQTTGLTPAEARELSLLLRAGALAAPVFKVEDRTIGPTTGKQNIERGFMAVQIGFLAVIIFMAVYYRTFGMIANVALLSNLVFMVAMLSMLQASLTLPGIAGIVLTVGMAVDANVLIFERIREEITAGNSIQASIHAGYEKAFSSIADANVTTLIAAIMLFAFGTGPIKGFAVTLSIGIVTSMFTSIVGTRAIVNWLYGGKRLEKLPIGG